ncbi:MAG: DUF3106 domain-containing protein, partial [Burkholderiales bacterium]
MAKASLALALWFCISLSAFAATPPKKPPTWGELSAEQKQILAPLASDWDTLEPARRRKWLGIAKRYPKMKPDQQVRVQRRMQAWANLSPKERQAARERYRKIETLPPDKKRSLKQKWEEYNRLPEQERRKLRGKRGKPPPARPGIAPAPSDPPPGIVTPSPAA